MDMPIENLPRFQIFCIFPFDVESLQLLWAEFQRKANYRWF